MAFYDFKCKCGKLKQVNLPISERDTSVIKCDCGKKMEREKIYQTSLTGFDNLGRSIK